MQDDRCFSGCPEVFLTLIAVIMPVLEQ